MLRLEMPDMFGPLNFFIFAGHKKIEGFFLKNKLSSVYHNVV